jgi:malate permease and related proteins
MIIIFEQLFILAIISIIGYLAFKLKAITKDNNIGLVRVIMKITLPLLIFTSFANADFEKEIISSLLYIIPTSVISVLVLFVLSSFSAKILKLDNNNKALHNVHTMFGNVVFLGFPLLNALFPGGKGLLYAAIFQLGHDTLMWTLGMFILNKSSVNKRDKPYLHLINPTTFSMIIGFLFMILQININELLFSTLHSVGHTTIYLSMIYVGAVLAQINPYSMLRNLRSYFLSINKLLLGPIIISGLFYLLNYCGLNIDKTVILSSVLQSAMPCMIIVSVIAKDMGLNENQAVENIFVSTILSAITLPLMYYLLNIIF